MTTAMILSTNTNDKKQKSADVLNDVKGAPSLF